MRRWKEKEWCWERKRGRENERKLGWKYGEDGQKGNSVGKIMEFAD